MYLKNTSEQESTAGLPFSVSFQTIPSRVTVVPGSHGPRQSGSVTTPTWQASTLASFTSAAGLGPVSDGPSEDSVADDDDDDDDVGGIGELAVSHYTTNSHQTYY